VTDIDDLYPPNPVAVPPDLTRPPGSYRARVFIVLCCLFAFLAVYLGLTVGTAYLSYYCFSAATAKEEPGGLTYNPRTKTYRSTQRSEKSGFWLVVGGVASAIICLFMVKGLFKGSRPDRGTRVEVTEADQPALFAFIRRLCQDTRAPFPHRVYLVPDVNAAVAYHESFLNLFFPARKNLIIGLGLVNRVSLTEFKAVLAHEFGHFSQKSMSLGSYVYTANRVVADVVYGRDWLDDLVAGATRTDIRIAVFAWALQAILWCLRKGLEGLFRCINFAHASLSRQMEYNADLVAASVVGSDALVFALARLDFAGESLGQAWADLTAAADHGRFSRDLYFHQTRAAEYLRVRRNDPTLGTVPALPSDPTQTVEVFKPEDTSTPRMWATHPSNYDREVNLKRRYVRGPVDDRPAWELFTRLTTIREAVTRVVYSGARRAPSGVLEDPVAVQAFIDAEHAETTYDPRYHGLYDDRYIKPGDLNELCCRHAWEEYDDPARLAAAHALLFSDDLKERMAAHKARHDEAGRLARLTHGAVELRGRDFEFRGRRYQLTDADRLLKRVREELDKDFEWMHITDRAVFRAHYAMAVQLGDTDRQALEERYRFHLALQGVYATLTAHSQYVQVTLQGLSGQRQVEPAEFQHALGVLRESRKVLAQQLDEADKLRLPPLTNMTAGEPAGRFLFSGELVPHLPPDTQSLNGAWIGALMGQFGEVIDKGQRLLFKSLGGLLAVQQEMAARWLAAHTAPGDTGAPPAPTISA